MSVLDSMTEPRQPWPDGVGDDGHGVTQRKLIVVKPVWEVGFG